MSRPLPPEEPVRDVSGVRPYLLTSGRAQPLDNSLEIESQVATSTQGATSSDGLSFEHRDIVELCRTTMSVAEIAALLRLHIGVARVLVADLAALGYVVVRRPAAAQEPDLGMIERVIRGLKTIQ
jgi:Protein of unknown function (DUF742)